MFALNAMNALKIAGALVAVYLVYKMYSTYTEGFEDDGKKTVVLFYAPWCGHCKNLKPAWETVAKRHQNDKKVEIKSIDCEKNPEKAKEHGVQGFPTIIVFKGGQRKIFNGERTVEKIEHFINSA